jgi:RNA polymerase sigma factor (sigma-70 family)
MVWSVCRNVLADADAEDAFQATFLALIRAGASIRNPATLGGWLHRVAVQVCGRTKRTAARRRRREVRAAVAEATRPEPDAEWQGLHAAVHEEIDRLPDRLRTIFVLCGLEGIRPTDAAARFGLRVGSVTGLLARARQRILARLKSRQLIPGLTGSGMALAMSGSTAAVPSELFDLVVSMTRPDFAAGASSVVLGLARHVLEAPMIQWKVLAAVVLVGTALSASVGGILATSAAQAPAPPTSNLPSDPTRLPLQGINEQIQEIAGQAPTTGLGQARNRPVVSPTEAHRTLWEYKVTRLRPDGQSDLNNLGKDGWELVAIDRTDAGILSAYLKRPKVETPNPNAATQSLGFTVTRPSTPSDLRYPQNYFPAVPGTSTSSTGSAPKMGGLELAVVRLQRLNAMTATALVLELYKGQEGFEGANADNEANVVVLKGSAAKIKEMKAMLEKLDGGKEEGPNLAK